MPQFRYGKFSHNVACPACGGTGTQYEPGESLRNFRKRVIEGNK